jgi:hypothetical protein
MKQRNPEHPAWQVYDVRRTARLRQKYFSCRLNQLQRMSRAMEIVVAATASSSAVAALSLWNTTTGQHWWQGLLVISAVVAIAKPVMGLSQEIQRLDELLPEYRLIEHLLFKIQVRIQQRNAFDADLQEEFNGILDRMDSIVVKPYESGLRKGLRTKCELEVDSELPSEDFIIPTE